MATIWYRIQAQTDDGRTLERERKVTGVSYAINPADLPVKDALTEMQTEGLITNYRVEVVARSVEEVK